MTSPISARPAGSRSRRSAFTLLELMMVIFIIVLLIGITVPIVLRGRTAAQRARTAADMAVIATALEAYAADFRGEYPAVDRTAFADGTGGNGRPRYPNGAQILCLALVGPPPASDAGAGTQRPVADGADGFGFRIGGTAGRVYGPYIQVDKFRIGEPAKSDDIPAAVTRPLKACILDQNNQPILYFPARKPKPDMAAVNRFFNSASGSVANQLPAPAPATAALPLFDLDDAFDGDEVGAVIPIVSFIRYPAEPSNQNAAQRFARMTGDRNMDGHIGAGESAATSAPYLLWSAGADERFGPFDPTNSGEVSSCDDVTNFSFQ